MKIYNCDVCGELVYFENNQCLNCSSHLGYLPYLDYISSVEIVDQNIWKVLTPKAKGSLYKKCINYVQEKVCNWMIPIEEIDNFCLSCRLNEMIPDLSVSENRTYWHRLEIAKRRLVYSLLRLNLPIKNKLLDPEKGLAFIFMAEDKKPQIKENKKILIGHEQGRITINIAEANDLIREKMRLDMNERYRTLLGHFRHEIGHYYWFLLIENNPYLLNDFRNLFGNEQENYNLSLKKYYLNKPYNWQENYVSAYASSHPWEDWAETWSHYFHMYDTLETAFSWGLSMKYKRGNFLNIINLDPAQLYTIEDMKHQWAYLSCVMNSLNRSMGLKDAYPFVLTSAVMNKLQFIQRVILSNPSYGGN